jgi:ubiquinone/menaquinone biosynthesis C-methylase UbiE
MTDRGSIFARRYLPSVLWIWFCIFTYYAAAQNVHPSTGRHIPPVMGIGGADWLDREERAKEEQPDKALAALDLHPGMMVGDVGAGTGFYSIRIAKRIAPDGIVYANDIQPGMLDRLRANASEEGVRNIQTILGTERDARLPAGKLDLIVLVDVYHEFSQPRKMLDSMRASLRPGGRLVLLEYRKEDANVPILPEHKMSVREVRIEVTPAGFRFVKVIDTLPMQHMIFFEKPMPQSASRVGGMQLRR